MGRKRFAGETVERFGCDGAASPEVCRPPALSSRPWPNTWKFIGASVPRPTSRQFHRKKFCIVVLAEKSQDANFAESFADWPELKERLANAEPSSRERGAITAMHSLKNVYKKNVALVGDASGSVDAITGEGLRLAFCQALALAEGMKRGDLREYQRVHQRLARRPSWMANLLLLLGRNAGIRQRALKSLAAKPGLFAELLAISRLCDNAWNCSGQCARGLGISRRLSKSRWDK